MNGKRLLLIIIHPTMPEGARKDDIKTKSASDAYRNGWDAIDWGKNRTDNHTVN